jgi:uncharacterized protein (DUF2252 family)
MSERGDKEPLDAEPEAGTEKRRYQAPKGPLPHLTREERVARGKAARQEVPRASHSVWELSPERPDPIEMLEEQARTRVPELVPIRYGRMLVSPFAFYRGAAAIMAADLSTTPRSGLNVQLCGDAHLSNFGIFASPERRMVFDINDFDETLPGPWEWDVKRLAASLVIAARDIGFSAKQARGAAVAAVNQYRTAMRRLAGMRNLDVWYEHIDIEDLLKVVAGQVDEAGIAATEKTIAKARTRDSVRAYDKLVRIVDGEPRIISDPPLIVPADELVETDREELAEEIRRILRVYRRSLQSDRRHLFEQFRFVDLARKVVGVGSVGTRAWIALMLGIDDQDPLFMQVKEAQPSVLEAFLPPSEYANHGQRVVAGQHAIQAVSDIFLGWIRLRGIDGVERDFYVRQLHDGKGSFLVESARPRGLQVYGRVCGATLAHAHARTGDRVAIAAYLGNGAAFDEAIADFSERYADQNDRDYRALVEAEKSGRIIAQTGL